MGEKQKILVVEDELINRRILRKLLSDKYEVTEAENGAVAIEILEGHQSKFVAVLLDIVMPVMDGYAFLEYIKKKEMVDIPIIVMTGSNDSETEKAVLDAGAWDFVTKPYNAKVLFSRLNNAIARSQVAVYKKLQKMAAHDSLTGLHNRARMFTDTRHMLKKYPDKKFVFLRLDIDHFALYNSAFGEEEGDRLLCYLADELTELSKKYELITYGRISADIFCVCAEYAGDANQLKGIVDYIQSRLLDYRKDYLLEISAGVYIIDDASLGVEECYLRASMGAQKCKSQYGKHIGYYDIGTVNRTAEELNIVNEMQYALDSEQFVVYLQPKIDISTDTACGAEALVRWIHPQKGLVSPGAFIPVFERNGFIAALDYYMWEHTCMMIREWMDAGYQVSPISVNVSRVSLYNPQLLERLTGLIEKYKLEYSILQLEITESAYMTDPELMLNTIHALRTAGFTILVDDFGSGYSSLNTLKDIEADILKVDMKFLPVGNEVEKGEIILASVIKMANWLGMSVVVEGVETREQRDFLVGVGCDYVQGYYYSRPVPREEYEEKYVFQKNVVLGKDGKYRSEVTPTHNVTVLVIDDDELDRTLLAEHFKDKYHIHECECVEDALAYLQDNKQHVRLILLDNIMPGMSGLDFLIYCQDDTELHPIPKIMITADRKVEDQVKAFQCGAYDYIPKPLVWDIVDARVGHVMAISEQYRDFQKWEYDSRSLAEKEQTIDSLQSTNKQLSKSVREAAEANHAKGEFLMRMSHEIRTPMNAIIGETALAQVGLKAQNPEKIEDCLNKIEVSSRHLLELINDVLDMSAIENNKIRISHNQFDIKDIVATIAALYYSQCKMKKIRFDARVVDLPIEFLIGDSLRIQQIILNLLSNALKFTRPGGKIVFQLSEEKQENGEILLHIQVRDTGCGIHKEYMKRIFEPFEQENELTAGEHGGSGLGLSITKNMVELMRGKIQVESEVGVGTTFSITIPCMQAPVQQSMNNEAIADMRAIVVDDDADALEYASSILNHIGILHDTAESGEEALNLITKARNDRKMYSLCLVDWRMHGMSGLELTKRIRQACGEKPVVVIASAYDLAEISDETQSAGVDACITKPYFQSTLFNILMRLSQGKLVNQNAQPEEYNFSGKRVLIVDDTEINREIASELLRMVGFEVKTANDGQRAIEIFEKSEPGTYDVILMDVQMPVMNGYEATRVIRRSGHPEAQSICIIAMTANAFAEDIAKSLEAGMNDHISKPIDTKLLYQVLSRYV
jgi:diguanylate cyclase (GGDEF)-like protein